MKIQLVTAIDAAWSQTLLAEMNELVRLDRFGIHEVVTTPDEADVVLFVDAHQYPSDWSMKMLRNHHLVRAYPDKVFVYDERDLPRDLLPGIYVAMPRRRFNPRRQRAFAYYRLRTDTRAARGRTPDLLFSFAGRRGGAVRHAVLGMSHPRAIVQDTSHRDFFAAPSQHLETAQEEYVEILGRSKFVLCPRGAGTASIRLFETLAAGRVPVIISDEWVPPDGIDWSACSVTIEEKDTALVGERLEGIESQWGTLAAAAERAYDDWFAPEVWLHRVVELCGELLQQREMGVARQYTQPETWRAASRELRARAARRSE